MYPTIDFLEYKQIGRYLMISGVILFGGWLLKDAGALLVTAVILYCCVKKNLFCALVTWLLWFFTQGFFVGQGLLTNQVILKYISKPSFILFIIFLFFLHTIPPVFKNKKFLIIWVCFLAIALASSLYHGQLPFVLITVSSFYILYLLLASTTITIFQYKKLLNLFTAISILQTIVCFLQIFRIIPAATKLLSDGNGGYDVWEAKLDDIASGTFGADSSHLVSWYASMIALFLVLVWVITKKNQYLIFAFFSIIQFATVDSKTVLIVMSVMMVYMLCYLYKNRTAFRIDLKTLVNTGCTMLVLGALLIFSWNLYYKYSSDQYGNGERENLKSVYNNEIKTSFDAISLHWTEWGKIQGFNHVTQDFLKEDPFELIGGYGLQGYSNFKMQYIEDKDTPLMQLDNSTRSRSGLILMYATSGVIGFLLILSSFYCWYKFNLWFKNDTPTMAVNIAMIKIFSLFTLIVAFLYSFDLTTIPVVGFSGLIAILQRYSEACRAQFVYNHLIKN